MMDRLANITGIEIRECINIALSVFTLVLCLLFVRYFLKEWRSFGYRWMGWPAKAAIGLSFLSLGEFIRSATVWEIIHSQGSEGTYATGIIPLLISLILITTGALCCIRVFTPAKWGHWPWITSAAVVAVLLIANWTVLT